MSEPGAVNGDQVGGCGAIERLEEFADTELGNAERFVARHGASVRHCAAFGSWYLWREGVWRPDTGNALVALMSETVRAMQARALELPPGTRRKDLLRWSVRSESDHRHRAALHLAESRPDVLVVPTDFDADAWLFNVANGTIDLRTGQFRAHRRADLCTKIAPVVFDLAAKCPRFLEFLEEIFLGRRDLISFVQRAVGYALTGSTCESVVFLLHGAGSNGKTTLIELLRRVLGSYADSTPFETFLVKQNDSGRNDELADLVGARLVTANEAPKGRGLNEALLKLVTGGDEVKARKLYGQWFPFHPQFKLWLAANHRPRVSDDSEGFWRRIRLIPFDARFPDDKADKALPSKLAAEAAGILNWAIEGCLAWQQQGLGTTEAVQVATDTYRAKEDPVGAFLAKCCELRPGATISPSLLAAAFHRWCEEADEETLNPRAFNQALRDRGLAQDRTGAKRFWKGVTLRPQLSEAKNPDQDPPPSPCSKCGSTIPPDRDSCEVCAIAEREAAEGTS